MSGMSEDDNRPQSAPIAPAGNEAAPRAPVRSRLWSLRTVAAATITAVALSGVGGAALAAASDGGSGVGAGPPKGVTRSDGGSGDDGRASFGQVPDQVPGQVPGQLPPAATGDDRDS